MNLRSASRRRASGAATAPSAGPELPTDTAAATEASSIEVKREPPPAERADARKDAAPPAYSARLGSFATEFRRVTPALRRQAPATVAVVAALAGGLVLGRITASAPPVVDTSPRLAALADQLSQAQAGIAALQTRSESMAAASDVQALERRLVSLREVAERTRADHVATAAQQAAALDKLRQDGAASSVLAAAQLGRIEDASREAATRLSAFTERSGADRAEAAPAALVTGSIGPAAPTPPTPPQAEGGMTVQAKSPEARPDGRTAAQTAERTPERADKPAEKPVLGGWVVHDVRRGVALVEGPGGLFEVGKGQTIPGAGRIEAIERKGRGWTVVTSRGLVEQAPW